MKRYIGGWLVSAAVLALVIGSIYLLLGFPSTAVAGGMTVCFVAYMVTRIVLYRRDPY